MTTGSLTFTVADGQHLTANQRLHHHPRAERTKAIRGTVAVRARAQRVTPAAVPLWIVAEVSYPDRKHRDCGNLYPTVKAAVDGLRDAGLLVDDDDAHLTGPHLIPTGQVTRGLFTIRLRWQPAAAFHAALGAPPPAGNPHGPV